MKVLSLLLIAIALFAVVSAQTALAEVESVEDALRPYLADVFSEPQLAQNMIDIAMQNATLATEGFLAADAISRGITLAGYQTGITISTGIRDGLETALDGAVATFRSKVAEIDQFLEDEVAKAAADGVRPYERALAAAMFYRYRLEKIWRMLVFYGQYASLRLTEARLENLQNATDIFTSFNAVINAGTPTQGEIDAVKMAVAKAIMYEIKAQIVNDRLVTAGEDFQARYMSERDGINQRFVDLAKGIFRARSAVRQQIRQNLEAWREAIRERALAWLEGATEVVVEVTGLNEGEALVVVLRTVREIRDGVAAAVARERLRRLAIALYVSETNSNESDLDVTVVEDTTNKRAVAAEIITITNNGEDTVSSSTVTVSFVVTAFASLVAYLC